jgi:WD40 repeat protein
VSAFEVFVSGSQADDNTRELWDTSTEKCLHTYIGHRSPVNAVAITTDDGYIISCGGNEIKIWDVKTGKCIHTISNQPYAGMQIRGAIGLTSGQIESLKALGAVDD